MTRAKLAPDKVQPRWPRRLANHASVKAAVAGAKDTGAENQAVQDSVGAAPGECVHSRPWAGRSGPRESL